MTYNIFYWLHIISYFSWLAAFAASLFLAFKAGRAFKSPGEKKFIKWERKVTSIGAHLGAAGILISGWVMSVIPGGPQWGWFNIPLYNWLAIKQLLFIIILILVGFSIAKSISFKKQISHDEGDLVSDQARQKWKSAYTISLVIYFLVAINTWLGLAKPI
jgi:uncharacterized membrane protein